MTKLVLCHEHSVLIGWWQQSLNVLAEFPAYLHTIQSAYSSMTLVLYVQLGYCYSCIQAGLGIHTKQGKIL